MSPEERQKASRLYLNTIGDILAQYVSSRIPSSLTHLLTDLLMTAL